MFLIDIFRRQQSQDIKNINFSFSVKQLDSDTIRGPTFTIDHLQQCITHHILHNPLTTTCIIHIKYRSHYKLYDIENILSNCTKFWQNDFD